MHFVLTCVHLRYIERLYMSRLGRKRLSVDLPEATHKKLMECAEKQGQTITVYVTRAIWEKIKREFGEKEMLKALK